MCVCVCVRFYFRLFLQTSKLFMKSVIVKLTLLLYFEIKNQTQKLIESLEKVRI